MFKKVLVANRGEIALRVIRACRDLGVASVAVYSEVDRGLRYVEEADEAVAIGAPRARESYLSVKRIIAAARKSGADSIHPGYGFLSENHELARAAERAGLTFIGPPAPVIENLGSKLLTRKLMAAAGVPVLPGTDASNDLEEVGRLAEDLGYPVLVKPSAGGGGRGMRIVLAREDLAEAFEEAQREAASSFGDPHVYLEKCLVGARHVEVQVLADTHGNLVHVGDRDCSLQRRHQKVVEEGPAPGLSDEQRATLRGLAVQAARAVGYVNAGTIEFLYDGDDRFYLLEVNTRIQVEHGVSEAISSIDLVAEQIRIASGETLSVRQEDVALRGHAIECRVYAEDPARGFASSPGHIVAARVPSGPWVRTDSSYEVGDEVTPYYDGMISKLVVWGPTREVALARTRRALAEYRISGIATNVSFLRWLLDSEAFRGHTYDTGFVEREFRPELLREEPPWQPTGSVAMQTSAATGEGKEEGRIFEARLFLYRRRSDGRPYNVSIHVVPAPGGGYLAVPVSPADQGWAGRAHRRSGPTVREAVDRLVHEVLNVKMIDEIFPELSMPY